MPPHESSSELRDRIASGSIRQPWTTKWGIARCAEQICAWHRSHVSSGPTEAVNNLAKRRVRLEGQLPTPPSPLPALRRQAAWTLLPALQP